MINRNDYFLKLARPLSAKLRTCVVVVVFFACALFCNERESEQESENVFYQTRHLHSGSIELILFPTAAHDCVPFSVSILSPFGFSEAVSLWSSSARQKKSKLCLVMP